MNRLRCVLLGLCCLPWLIGCGGGGDEPEGGGRIVPYLLVTTQSTATVLSDHLTVIGDHHIQVMDEPESSSASLELRGLSREVDDVWLRIDARQDLDRASLNTRYLSEQDFTRFEASLSLGDVQYVGTVLHFDVHLDLYMRVHVGSIEIRFDPIAEDTDAIEFSMQVEGYINITCSTGSDGTRETSFDPRWPPTEPAACTEIFDRIRATPDDPDAPAPPYDLYADDTPDGDGSSSPVAVPPD